MHKNRLIIAAAGSGKTTFLVDEALRNKNRSTLITTYTQANEAGIRAKLIEKCKCIPSNVSVETWFSFLLRHGVRPYQGCLFEKTVRGMLLVNGQSGEKYRSHGRPVYFSEAKEFEQHYFTPDQKIYSDKLSKFVIRCSEKSNGAVLQRLSKIYDDIFIDEVQDLAAYDLEVLKLIFSSPIRSLLVGDPRQATYSTNVSPKHKQFRKSDIVDFFEDKALSIEKDDKSLVTNYRCVPAICALSDRVFPDYSQTTSGNNLVTGHDGVFVVRSDDVSAYLEMFKPMQLRDSARAEVDRRFAVMNFGESKGLDFDRVIIYPTRPIADWLKNNACELAPTSRSKLYVAITRARFSVAIVYDYGESPIEGVTKFKMDGTLA
jgi:superfamily I DNA/RNA helicase